MLASETERWVKMAEMSDQKKECLLAAQKRIPARSETWKDKVWCSAACLLRLIGKTATETAPVGAAPDRRQSYILWFQRAMGSGIIGLQRSNIAHHRRAWPAKPTPERAILSG